MARKGKQKVEPAVVYSLPVLPIKDAVLFPEMVLPLSVGRPQSVAAVQAALESETKELLVVAQRDPSTEQPSLEDLFSVGTKGVVKNAGQSDGALEVLVQGVERVTIMQAEQTEPYLKVQACTLPRPEEDEGAEFEALRRAVIELAQRGFELAHPQSQIPLNQIAAQRENTLRLFYFLASVLGLDYRKQQQLLEAATQLEAVRLLHGFLSHEVQVLEIRHKIAAQARSEMSQEQREYMLRQQLKAIQQELGEKSPEEAGVEELRKQLEEAELPEPVRKEAERELRRLERLPPAAPDYQLTRTYLELIAELPWNKSTQDTIDLSRARRVLDEDHYDLNEVKERILEHLAVMKLNPHAHSPILCFVGPPGVGKTSLGQSIARAIGRRFERMSLGGLHDEAELRGHRRTYIGAMPGRIIQAMRRAGVNNPLLMLDEVDKLGQDFRGDPASALLEVLDPEQNATFRDNYLDLPFDLSKVFFITTANSLHTIPRPLLDRMEVIRLAGYSEEEKMEIAKRYLIPRQIHEAGLSDEQLRIPDPTLRYIITRYTREAGVRELERTIGRIARKVAKRVSEGHTDPLTVHPDDLADLLGPERYRPEQARPKGQPGVVTGLAWTEAGGEVLNVEACLLPEGKGLRLTGQLGEVMRESAKAAQSYVWSHAGQLGIDLRLFHQSGVHLHVPAGAVPKDGPSAGVAMVAALASLYSGVPARHDTAMTGEITLTGRVLPVGGIKEKVLAARSAGIQRVILPEENRKDLKEIPDPIRDQIHFVFVETVDEVLREALPGLASRRFNWVNAN
ncbi:MAG TPA: endopeptidase La [Planctomycetes bacterium]|nr:endopeptidase La [Planctomycetota bacterium]